MNIHGVCFPLGMAAVLVLTAMPAFGDSETKGGPIGKLKSAYLACERAATSGALDTGSIMQCSVVYEELKRRAFGGDFEKLFAWSKAQQAVRLSRR